ncbi:MAG: FecR domain-containing protein [Leptospira sp.]|nr:FecR domain-containing protein [Leptospira sp.]
MVTKILGILVIIALLGCGGKAKEDAIQADSKIQPVTVTFFSGDSKILRAGVESKPAQGMELTAEDEIVTGLNGRVEVLVRNSGLIKISSSSSVSISSLIRNEEESSTNVHLNYGKVVTVVRKEKKNESYNVVTPTLVAGVRGTIFMTSVENPGAGAKGVACSQNDCLVKVEVVEGAVAVRHKESGQEVIVEKNSGIEVKGKKNLSQDLVKSLNQKSLDELKDMIVFHKSGIGGFENLADELKLQTRELSDLDSAGSLNEIKAINQKKAVGNTNDEARKIADETDESRYLKKDIAREKLKMDPKESF